MGVPPEVFDDDYLYFYDDVLGPERSDADAEVVAALLEVVPGARVLDVPCGEGRIGGRLARRGCRVLGVDITERFLELGRERYPEMEFVRGDMRELGFEHEFDAVVNWYTSFGYFEPDTNDAVLRGFARALRSGGRLLIELHNPEHFERLIELAGGETAAVVEREGNLMVDRITYDAAQSRTVTTRFVVRDGVVRRVEFTLEQVPAPELRRRLQGAGFGDVQLFGRRGGPFDPLGPRLIALARR